jgi:hypothetical protein
LAAFLRDPSIPAGDPAMLRHLLRRFASKAVSDVILFDAAASIFVS